MLRPKRPSPSSMWRSSSVIRPPPLSKRDAYQRPTSSAETVDTAVRPIKKSQALCFIKVVPESCRFADAHAGSNSKRSSIPMLCRSHCKNVSNAHRSP